MTNTVVILNPAAGSPETLGDWQERVESIAHDCPIRVIAHPGEAEALARNAVEEGFVRIVAAGGDGTVNHVANGIAGTNAALGLLPLGTVNVFAMELGLPANNLQVCWSIIEDGNVRLVDLPNANGKHFVQLAGVGLDAQVVKETSLAFKRSFGPLSYLISAAQIAARKPWWPTFINPPLIAAVSSPLILPRLCRQISQKPSRPRARRSTISCERKKAP